MRCFDQITYSSLVGLEHERLQFGPIAPQIYKVHATSQEGVLTKSSVI